MRKTIFHVVENKGNLIMAIKAYYFAAELEASTMLEQMIEEALEVRDV